MTMAKALWTFTEVLYVISGIITFTLFTSPEAPGSPTHITMCILISMVMLLIGCMLDILKDVFI